MMGKGWQEGNIEVLAKTAVLLLAFILALFSLQNKAPTFDEQSYITRGLGYIRGENRYMRVGHPLGMNALSASFLLADETVLLPSEDPSWQLTNFHRPSELFMWEIGNNVERIIFLGRMPTIWLTMLLIAVVGRWCLELTQKRWAAVLAMAFVAFDPNILANGRLATTDLALTFGATLAGWLLWRYFRLFQKLSKPVQQQKKPLANPEYTGFFGSLSSWIGLNRPAWQAVALAAVGFAILQNTKFTAGLYVPLFAVVSIVGLWSASYKVENREKSGEGSTFVQRLIPLLIGYPLIAFVALWAMYGFQIGTLPEALPIMPQLSGTTLPLAHHLEQLLDIGGRLQKTTPAFLSGNYSESGWRHYFLVAFGVKTPLATLLLLVVGLYLMGRRWVGRETTAVSIFDTIALLVPALGFFAIALTTDINLGYRQILPILPFLIIWAVREFSISNLPLTNNKTPITNYQLPIYLSLFLLFTAIFNFPHYLPFFNIFAGGADNGYKTLVDSNLDWGQDLPLLKEWMDEKGVSRVWLSYFGEARPEYYGINYIGLDSFPPRLMQPDTRPFYPDKPNAGIYAISATTLQGVHFADHNQFAFFQKQEPIAKLGHSIFLYLVEAEGEPIELILDEIQLDELTAVDVETLDSNQFDLHWMYEGDSLYFPAQTEIDQKEVWVATRRSEDWLAWGEWDVQAENSGYELLRLIAPPDLDSPITFQWTKDDASMFMALDWQLTANLIEVDSRLSHDGLDHPLRQFIHFTNDQEEILAQWDGLDTAWQGWKPDDRLVQFPTLMVPADLPEGLYQMWTGLYNPETGERYTIGLGDGRLLMGVFEVDENGIRIVMNDQILVSGVDFQVSSVRCQMSNIMLVPCQFEALMGVGDKS